MRGNCPFNFGGGRSDFANVWNSIDEPVCNLMAGGGGIWSNLMSRDIVVNDICKPLLEFQQIIYELGDISSVVSSLYAITGKVDTREDYEDLRMRFNDTNDPILYMSLISCCNNNQPRFNTDGIFNQTWGRRKFNHNQERKLWDFKRRIANKSVVFVHGDFTTVKIRDRIVIASPPLSWKREQIKDLETFVGQHKHLILLTEENAIGKKAKMMTAKDLDRVFAFRAITNIPGLKIPFGNNSLF